MNITSKFTGLLIDFDGTLANTELLHQLALKTFFDTKGIEFGKKEPGKSTLHIFRDWGKRMKEEVLAEKYLKEYLEFICPFFAEHLDQVDWCSDVANFLEKTTSFPIILVTGSFRSWLEVLDHKLHIFEKFPLIVTKEEALPDREKPDPWPYLLAAQKLSLAPESCLAIEDSYSGILSAKKAGCYTVAIARDELKGFEEADKIVNTLTELIT